MYIKLTSNVHSQILVTLLRTFIWLTCCISSPKGFFNKNGSMPASQLADLASVRLESPKAVNLWLSGCCCLQHMYLRVHQGLHLAGRESIMISSCVSFGAYSLQDSTDLFQEFSAAAHAPSMCHPLAFQPGKAQENNCGCELSVFMAFQFCYVNGLLHIHLASNFAIGMFALV